MKVDFITRHAIPNYGSILQTYSMQKMLEKLGYEAEVIDYIPLEETSKHMVETNCHIPKQGLKNKIKRGIYRFVQKPNVDKMHKTFKKYRSQYLNQTQKEYHTLEELKEDLPQADMYCTGSDQLWGKIGTKEYDSAYFLDFVPTDKKCIAYAASFGVDKLPTQLDSKLANLLEKYDRILVRENSAEKIIKEKGIENVKQVLDPTLLLPYSEWEKICEPTKLEGKDYILVYQLHHNKQMENYIKKLEKLTKLPIYRIHPSFYYGLKPGKFIYLPTPGQFVSYIKNAKYFLTDSFHGTVFSLIFHTPFVDVLPGETSTRIESILKLVGLENRILKENAKDTWLEEKIDFTKVDTILEQQRQKSLQDLQLALGEKPNHIEQMNLHMQCCGCRCCEQICPKQAIHMEEDEEGFFIPVIDKEKCIHCGLCLKKCPQMQENVNEETVEGYAAKNKQTEEQKKSSSGGIFSILAKQVLQDKGVVYGVAFNKECVAEHIKVETEEELEKLRGSKYVQSDTGHTYSEVKKNLQEGKKVLYSGTPCQIAGLKQFLGQDFENLYTVDLVCHGVPSPALFEKYKKNLEEKQASTIKNYNFRDKSKKGWGLHLKVEYQNQKKYETFWTFDSYYKSFLQGNTYRECCYHCKYANRKRVADITLADFWGIEKIDVTFYDKNGVSAILINSPKGKKLWEKVKEKVEYKPQEVEKIQQGNHNLKESTIRPAIRNVVYKGIKEKNYTAIEKENLQFKKELKDRLKQLVPETVKRKIRRNR